MLKYIFLRGGNLSNVFFLHENDKIVILGEENCQIFDVLYCVT